MWRALSQRALSQALREKLERDALLPPEAVSSSDHGCLLHPSLSPVISPFLSHFSFLSVYQMAKNKRKSIGRRPHIPAPPSTTGLETNPALDRMDVSPLPVNSISPPSTTGLEINPALDRLDVSPLPVNSSSIGGTNGPISTVQRPHSNGPLVGTLEANHYNKEELDEELEADVVSCPPCPAPPPLPPSSPNDVGSPQLASAMAVASGSKHLDVVLVEDCSDDEILNEDQLDFNFTDEECEDSPQAPAMLPAPHLSSPPPLFPAEQPPLLPKKVMSSAPIFCSKEFAPPSVTGKPIPAPSNNKWRDLFSSSKSTNPFTKLQNFSLNHLSQTCVISQRISSRDLKFGIFVLWVMLLGKILASKRFKELSPLTGSVRPR